MLKKTTIILIFIFGIIFLLSLLVILNPRIVSKIIYRNELSRFVDEFEENSTIRLLQEDIDIMNEVFRTSETEMPFCFETIRKDNFNVFTITITEVENATRNSAIVFCPRDSMLKIHTHPSGNCKFSDTDLNTFQNNHKDFEGIICGNNMFKIIDRQNITQNIKVIP